MRIKEHGKHKLELISKAGTFGWIPILLAQCAFIYLITPSSEVLSFYLSFKGFLLIAFMLCFLGFYVAFMKDIRVIIDVAARKIFKTEKSLFGKEKYEEFDLDDLKGVKMEYSRTNKSRTSRIYLKLESERLYLTSYSSNLPKEGKLKRIQEFLNGVVLLTN